MIPPAPPEPQRPTKAPPLKLQPAKPQAGDRREVLYTKKKPMAYNFRSQRYSVSTFKEILIGLCEVLYRLHGTNFERVLELCGRKRVYFSREFKGMTSPQEIPGSRIYAETNLSANAIMERCNELLDLFGHARDELRVELQDR